MNGLRSAALTVCVLLLNAVLVSKANAISTTFYITFTASNFESGAPFDPVFGSITVTFDPTVDASGAAELGLIGINFESPIGFVYTTSDGTLILGGVLPGGDSAGSISGRTNDFMVSLNDFLVTPDLSLMSYAQVATGFTFFSTNDGNVTVFVSVDPLPVDPLPEVPLPAALPLFATVLAAGGLIALRRKRKAVKLAA